MGSNYFGEQNYFGNERGLSSSSSSSSSRKGKKSVSDKPKQPQRGLGVAQLEKIRLHSEISCTYLPSSVPHNPYASNYTQEDMRLQTAHSSSFSYPSLSSPPYGFQGHHGVVMGMPDLDRGNVAYGDSQSTNITRWHPAGYGTQHFVEPSITRSFFEPPRQGTLNMNKKDDSDPDVDLELRLSL